jgi:hypothetical protein
MRRKNLIFGNVAILVVVLIFTIVSYGSISADSTWEEIGQGNLKATNISGEVFLVESREDLSNVNGGLRLFGFRTINADTPNKEKFKKESVTEKNLSFNTENGLITVKNLILKGKIVSSEAKMELSPDGSKVLYDLGSNSVWLTDSAGNNSKNIGKPDNDFMDQLTTKLNGNSKDDYGHGLILWWMNQPHWVGNKKIAFVSNRDVFPEQQHTSIFLYDLENVSIVKIIDGSNSKEDLNIIKSDENTIIVYGGMQDNIIRYDVNAQIAQTFNIKGSPISASNDGKYVLFNEIAQNDTVTSDISILDTTTGEITKIPFIEGYSFYNGSWSPDNLSYVFYTMHFSESNAKIYRLDAASKHLYEVPKPKDIEGNLNPTGAISWINNESIVASMNDGFSWKIFLGKGATTNEK